MEDKEIKKYHIETFKQILNVVNKENRERFILDFAHFLFSYIDVIDSVRNEHPDLSEKLNTEIAECAMEWKDNGVHEIERMDFIVKETGEYLK